MLSFFSNCQRLQCVFFVESLYLHVCIKFVGIFSFTNLLRLAIGMLYRLCIFSFNWFVDIFSFKKDKFPGYHINSYIHCIILTILSKYWLILLEIIYHYTSLYRSYTASCTVFVTEGMIQFNRKNKYGCKFPFVE